MEKKYVVKEFKTQKYWAGKDYGYTDKIYYAEYFDDIEQAENHIKRENGGFQIDVVYVV